MNTHELLQLSFLQFQLLQETYKSDHLCATAETGMESSSWTAFDHIAHLARYQEVFLSRIQSLISEPDSLLSRYRAEDDPKWPEWRNQRLAELATRSTYMRGVIHGRLEKLTRRDWQRTGIHPAFGRLTIASWFEFFLVHEGHHLYRIFQLARVEEPSHSSG